MLNNETMARIRRHADNRKDVIAGRYANVVQAPGASRFHRASDAGIDLALEKLSTGGIDSLGAFIDDHEATDRLWRKALHQGRKISIAGAPVNLQKMVEHGIEIREMKLMLKFARRMARLAEREQAARARTAQIISLARRAPRPEIA